MEFPIELLLLTLYWIGLIYLIYLYEIEYDGIKFDMNILFVYTSF